ncbi:SDR family oxidoreductase [Pseudoduganella namucuonensis]|uniref:Short-chain dehydrogenase n=1 Tax=Pseudoduganella namucuonensis TaxID=1035707 RepID=A0A1I7KU34_9BURK|nr:SDR family oxidoreductase [Pseudoduganella namucuonensis]SFV00814.1 Short-chain dehydrogenase [Pseudoduganella namucuonensis]
MDMKPHIAPVSDDRRPPRAAPAPGRRPAIFITGAASGIGRACAELFAARGWFVGLYDLNAEGVADIAATLGEGNATSGALDVCYPDAWQRALAHFWQHGGQRLDVLLNNAGVLTAGPFETVALARHHAMLDVNVASVVAGCHSAYSYLRLTPGARVINMASATAIYGQPELVTYSATKFAVRGFTEGLDLEWSKVGIRVSAIWPSFVNTAMAAGFTGVASAKSLGIRLTPADVAATVWRCATTRRLIHKTHWTVGLQAGLLSLGTRIAPAPLTRWIVGKLAR